MSELRSSQKKKVIAFYLPQYHTISENDRWWGEGFTDWDNVKKAVSLFEGHYQPKTPLDRNYYDLSEAKVMERQAALAKKFGIYGFCYYHYWFKNGKKLLERPVEQMLYDKKVDIPFCLSWANENWTRNWDGGESEVIARQEYGRKKEWKQHFDYLLPFFKDERYIKHKGCPIFIIYKPEQIVLLDEMIKYWKKLSCESGLPGLIVMRQFPGKMYKSLDYAIKFQPTMFVKEFDYSLKQMRLSVVDLAKLFIKKLLIYSGNEKMVQKLMIYFSIKSKKSKNLKIFHYDDAWNDIINHQKFSKRICNGAFTDWDNTARSKKGVVFLGSCPEKFEYYMRLLLAKPSALNLVFINAWNEWAEGAYLEPDEKYGYAYLEALQNSINAISLGND